ncbi:MAG: hypothetical protein R8G66_32620 [Cytophagales bacterium]|nr:hypothetical protein [Cytophagales bacterium]
MARSLLFLYLSFTCLLSYSQDIPVGTWRNHFSFNSIQFVASDGERTFAASEFALFLFEDEEITRLSKIDGLNGGAITGLAYAAENDVLLIGYEDGGVDLIQEGELINLSELTALNFGTSRAVNDFVITADRAYAATNFGIATINLNSKEITEIFREIGTDGDILRISEILFQDGILYAASNQGVQSGNLASNLLDFNNWTLAANTMGFQNIIAYENEILASRDSVIYSLNSPMNTWDTLRQVSFEINDLDALNNQLFVLGTQDLLLFEGEIINDIAVTSLADGSEVNFNQGQLWIADQENGLINIIEGTERVIRPSGPASDDIANLEFADNLYVFYVSGQNINEQDSTGFAVFSNGQWENQAIIGLYNVSDVAIYEGTTYLSTLTQGIYDFTNSQFVNTLFTGTNIAIPALASTSDGLYAIRHNDTNALYRLNEDAWESWTANEVGSATLVDMLPSQGNVLWLEDQSRGLIAFDPDSEQLRVINESDGLASRNIQSLVIDLDDQAWIGTSSGISFFVEATFIFDNFNAFTPFFENRVLFDQEAVTAMAIDGGNQKWMATKDGIWVFDENVITLETRFTAENSPLPSNTILDFAYDPNSGEMFILTDRGLVSYRTGSSAGSIRHSNVQIFPNPIRPQDTGPVTLRGLAQNANIKITDVQGNLIREIDALGGTAAWDLRDTSGSPTVSGIYLFFSSVGGREETFVGKIAVIR